MNYIKLVISVAEKYQEAFIAELEEMEFEGFQQTDDELICYIRQKRFHIGDREQIEQVLTDYPGNGYIRSEEVVAEKNWNREWEKTIQPQRIGPFLVKPTWSSAQLKSNQILLEIDPKMAFGTGYHPTTRLMLQQLPEIIQPGDRVLEAGTGTGILAIAAVKLGAEAVLAFDNDDWSIRNASQNILLNEVDHAVEIKSGSINTVSVEQEFDVILANINRNIILGMMPDFANKLNKTGTLLLSGLLKNDEKVIKDSLQGHGLHSTGLTKEEKWIAISANKKAGA